MRAVVIKPGGFEYGIKLFRRLMDKSTVLSELKNKKTHVTKAEGRKLSKLAAKGRSAKLAKEQQRELMNNSLLMVKEEGVRRKKAKPKFVKPRRQESSAA